MAVELLPENSNVGMNLSPRISFSHDLSQNGVVPVEQLLVRSNSESNLDFDFCVFRESFEHESSTADELFSDGKILPIQIKKRFGSAPNHVPAGPPPPTDDHRKILKSSSAPRDGMKIDGAESEEKQKSQSFWRFKRSSSLNCGNGYATTLCPLPLLSRSNSTGSAPSVKRSTSTKESLNYRQNFPKSHQFSVKQSQTSNSTSHSHQKPPLKKAYGAHCSGVRINPVLNVPKANFFGLGSIFPGGKDKYKKK